MNASLHGTVEVPFSELFKSTVQELGLEYALDYYLGKHKMQTWEFGFWMVATELAVRANVSLVPV